MKLTGVDNVDDMVNITHDVSSGRVGLGGSRDFSLVGFADRQC